MDLVALFARLLLGAVFLMSGLTKLAAPRQFAIDVRQYRILPATLSDAVAYMLPFAEVAAAALLLSGFYSQWGAVAATGMLIVFMAAVAIVMVRGQDVSCACFGLLYRERVGWQTEIRDGILLALAMLVLVGDKGTKSVSFLASNLDRPLHLLALAVTIAVTGFALVLAIQSVRHARRHEPFAQAFVGNGDSRSPDQIAPGHGDSSAEADAPARPPDR